MSELEISMARAYLRASDQDAVAALIRSVKDLAHSRRMLASLPTLLAGLYNEEPTARSLRSIEETAKIAA